MEDDTKEPPTPSELFASLADARDERAWTVTYEKATQDGEVKDDQILVFAPSGDAAWSVVDDLTGDHTRPVDFVRWD